MDYTLSDINPFFAVPFILLLLCALAWKLSEKEAGDDDQDEDPQ